MVEIKEGVSSALQELAIQQNGELKMLRHAQEPGACIYMEDALKGHVMPWVLRSMNIAKKAKAGINIDKVISRPRGILRAPMDREETLEEILDVLNTCRYRFDER